MKATEITFDEDFQMWVFSEHLNKEIGLGISDDLDASEEELTNEYKEKIARFVNNMPQWYNIVLNSIITWAKDTYKIDAHPQEIELMNVYVLFEQNADELFGVMFRVEFDIEHGCGVKIKATNGKYEVFEIGEGCVAY